MNARLTLTIAAATFITLAAGSAVLAQSADTRSVAVAYNDVNMSSASGRAVMQHRLLTAARTVCYVGSEMDLTSSMAQARCLKAALEGGQAELANKLRPTMASR